MISISNVLYKNGQSPAEASGLTKNMRKRRNRKMKHASAAGGVDGLRTLMASTEFNAYINPARLNRKPQNKKISTLSTPAQESEASTENCGGWGRLPNVAKFNYAPDDPSGWTYVGPHKRTRGCRILDDSEE